MKKLIAVMLLLGWGSAFAIPVQWTFQDVYLDDGSTLTGSFIVGEDENFPDFLLETRTASGLESTSENFLFVGWSHQSYYYYSGYAGDHAPEQYASVWEFDLTRDYTCPGYGCTSFLNVVFDQALTEAGGTVTFTATETIQMYDPPLGSNIRSFTGVVVGAQVVPIPAAAYLFASGLGLLGWFRRRQTAKF